MYDLTYTYIQSDSKTYISIIYIVDYKKNILHILYVILINVIFKSCKIKYVTYHVLFVTYNVNKNIYI